MTQPTLDPSANARPTPPATTTPRRRWLAGLGLLTVAALGAGGVSAWLGARADTAAKAGAAVAAEAPLELLTQDVVQVRTGELGRTLDLTGTLQALHRAELKSPLPGQVATVHAREGERVRKGQILVTLDTADLQARLRDRVAALDGGQAQLTLADKNRANQQTLLDKDFISQAAFDNTQGSYRSAEAAVRSLQAQVEQARKAVANAVIRSPIDGVVASRTAEPGLSVPANAALVSVHDLSSMELEVMVPVGRIPAVRVGQPVSFGIEGFDGRRFDGQVERIAPSAAAGARSIAVFVRVANPDRQLRGGMFAEGRIAIEPGAPELLLPAAAVRDVAGTPHVLRIDGERLVDVPVTIGRRDTAAGLVAVRQGLAEGDRVVLSNAPNIRAGRAVTLLSTPAHDDAVPAAPRG